MPHYPKIFQRQISENDRWQGIELGDEVRDSLTGFAGIVVCQNSSISGCDQLAVQPPCVDGKFEESRWFDIERIELVTKGKVERAHRRTGADEYPPTRTPRNL